MYKKKAFTLIELLVVISIIALLIAILMPALNKAREQASGSVCLGNQKALVLAYVMYADENDDLVVGANTRVSNGLPPYTPYVPRTYAWVDTPPTADLADLSATTEEKKEGIKRGYLWPYLEAIDVYHCPGDRRERSRAASFRSYSLPAGLNAEDDPGWWGVIPAKKLTQIKRPSSKYVFVEESSGTRGANRGSWVLYPQEDARYWVDPLAIWHNDRSSLSFADGHAEMITWVDESTAEMAAYQTHWWEVHAPEGTDLDFMKRAYPYSGERCDIIKTP